MRFTLRKLNVCSTVLLLSLAGSLDYVRAQSAPEERPRLKDFGSSLKRLKWDSRRQAAVETKGPAKRADQIEDDVVRVETNLVVCSVQVWDQRGKTITGLTQDDFLITEDGQPQRIQHFSLGNDLNVTRTIVLLIDYSGSQYPYIKTSVAAAKNLVDQLGPKDLMAIVTDDVALLVDFTRDKVKLKKALDSLRNKSENQTFGRSRQFSALMATVREMFTPEDIRPIVIFQTDGDQLFSLQPSIPPIFSIPTPEWTRNAEREQFSLRDLYYVIEKSRASVYTVIPGLRYVEATTERDLKKSDAVNLKRDDLRKLPPFAFIRWQQLAAAGAAIGGWTAYLQKPEEANDIYANILADINSRYVIGYYPANKTHDGKRRKVLVEVRDRPEYSVSGRRSYVAPEPEP